MCFNASSISNDFDTGNEFVPEGFEVLKSDVAENGNQDNELEIEFRWPEAGDDDEDDLRSYNK